MSGPLPKLGFLALSEADSIDLLLESLEKLGWIKGGTFEVVFPPATQDLAKLAGNMQQLLDAKVDVIVAQTKPAIVIAKDATSTIPIVMGALNGDPVKEGFVQSLQRPGGNITGSYYDVKDGAAGRVGVLAEFLPAMKSIGILLVSDSDASTKLCNELAKAAEARDLIVTRMPVCGGQEVDGAFGMARQKGVEGVVCVTAAEMFAIRREVAAAQTKHRLPTVMGSIGFPELGGLAKFGPEVPALWDKMAPDVDKILRGTANPADLPLITVDGFQLDVNLDVARDLGLTVSDALRTRAVRVIGTGR
jgi:putative ABC transport system substrate-binding protein